MSDFDAARALMVERQLRERGIEDERVLAAMGEVPRELFVPERRRELAYADAALPIGSEQTISQPWIVARMTEALIEQGVPERVLEIGTGSGYQAAVLAGIVTTVYTVERIEELLRQARRRFRQLGIENLRSRHDDGKLGWESDAPFDAIILTAAGDRVPMKLLDQLRPGGVLVAPVGSPSQQVLLRLRKGDNGEVIREELGAVSFVPLLGGIG